MGLIETDGALDGWFDGEDDFSFSRSLCEGTKTCENMILRYIKMLSIWRKTNLLVQSHVIRLATQALLDIYLSTRRSSKEVIK